MEEGEFLKVLRLATLLYTEDKQQSDCLKLYPLSMIVSLSIFTHTHTHTHTHKCWRVHIVYIHNDKYKM